MASGQYKDENEAVQAALNVLQIHSAKIAALRDDIQKGKNSGSAGELDFAELRTKARAALEQQQKDDGGGR